MGEAAFRYQPTCSVRGCGQPASYKVAAPWSSGTSRELKNYGLACEEHREAQLSRAREARAVLEDGRGGDRRRGRPLPPRTGQA